MTSGVGEGASGAEIVNVVSPLALMVPSRRCSSNSLTALAVKEFDEHLRLGTINASGETTLTISAPDAPSPTPDVIKIGGNVQQSKLIKQPHPVYPPDAKAARIQGTVKLQAVIAK